MPYCFEARFRLARPIPADKLEQELKAATFKQPLQFSKAYGMNTSDGWLAVKSCGYADFGEAEASGKLFQDGLLIVAAKQKVGVEFYLRGAASAIYVYSGQIELWDPGLPLPTLLTNDELKEVLGAAMEGAAALTANQRVAAELLNDSLFNMSPEASFLLRVSAIEALCPQPDQSDAFKTIVDGLIASIPKESLSSDREQIEQTLKMLAARQSIGRACRSKIKKLIGDDKAKKFDALYGQRSKLLHEGTGRGKLDAPAADALELGLELLAADIKQSTDPVGSVTGALARAPSGIAP
jgi:hypothetical protein